MRSKAWDVLQFTVVLFDSNKPPNDIIYPDFFRIRLADPQSFH